MRVVLISTYDLGRQSFGLASPTAWLRQAGMEVHCFDLSRQTLKDAVVTLADAIGFFLPMHTATRLAIPIIQQVRNTNRTAHIFAYGLYAPMNADLLKKFGVVTFIGGEFEEEIVKLINRLQETRVICNSTENVEVKVPLIRQQFIVPERSNLPALSSYAKLVLPNGNQMTVGYTEASRGCKHLCRHCPIVPVYHGIFRIVQKDIVLEDIRRQIANGAQHITFGDPDFFNGIRHATDIIQCVHREFPELTYDVTIKIEHLLKHAVYLPLLRDTGCIFITTAVESFDNHVLGLLGKHHTYSDFLSVVELFNRTGLSLSPTFVAFHPWTTLNSYEIFLQTISELGLVECIFPIQLSIKLLIPAGSYLLKLPEVQEIVGDFDESVLSYRWSNQNPCVDALQLELEDLIWNLISAGRNRTDIFTAVWTKIRDVRKKQTILSLAPPLQSRTKIPYLTEPWYC